MSIKLSAVSALLFLGACASLNEEACRSGDWDSIGYNDGARGRSQSYINEHRDACSEFGISPNTTAWLRARAEGLKVYCTPENSYDAGRRGGELNNVCPASQFGDLRLANFFGLRYYEINEEIGALTEEMEELIFLLETTADLDETVKSIYLARILNIQKTTFGLQTELYKYAQLP